MQSLPVTHNFLLVDAQVSHQAELRCWPVQGTAWQEQFHHSRPDSLVEHSSIKIGLSLLNNGTELECVQDIAQKS